VALIAAVVEEQQERAVGLGQLEPIQNDPTAAEVAIVLRDDYQGEGLGKARFDLLLQVALVRGLKRIVAITLAENEMMYLLAREAGFPVTSETHQGETTVMIGLSDT
jgi:L-amino acid N-acyltransferase YncA